MNSLVMRKSGKKKIPTHNRHASTRKSKTKMTFSIPDSHSEESSLDENYLENYSTESDYSDSKQHEPDAFSSGEEFTEGNGPCVPLFSAENDKGELSVGAEFSKDRLDKYFGELRKSDKIPSFPDPDTVFKSKAKGDFIWPDFRRKPSGYQNQKPAGHASTSSCSVKPPDPKSVPEVVLRLHNNEDVVKNRKVLDYLNQLEAAENDVNRRMEANIEVRAEEIKSLHAARDAILKQFGYDFRDTADIKRNEQKSRRRQMRKNEFPSGVSVSSSSESDDSERPLKEEVTRRFLNAGQENVSEFNFADLIKHSPRWTACVEEEMTEDDRRGKIENMTRLTDRFRCKKNKQ